MNTQSKLLVFLIVTASTNMHAIDHDIGAHISFNQTLAVTPVNNINFGSLQFSENSSGGFITVTTNNYVVGASKAGYIATGQSSAGKVNIIAASGENIMVSCSNLGTLTSSANSNHVLNLAGVGYHLQGLSFSPGQCSPPSAYNFTSTGDDMIVIGGSLEMPSGANMHMGSYSTSNEGGTPITLTVSYQ